MGHGKCYLGGLKFKRDLSALFFFFFWGCLLAGKGIRLVFLKLMVGLKWNEIRGLKWDLSPMIQLTAYFYLFIGLP